MKRVGSVCASVCTCACVLAAEHPWGSPQQISTKVIDCGGGHTPCFDPWGHRRPVWWRYPRGSDNRITIYIMSCVLYALVHSLHTCMNSPIHYVCPFKACMQVISVSLRLLCLFACMNLAFKTEQFSCGWMDVSQIIVFASLILHIREEILVSTTQILLSVYPMDYKLQIIRDNKLAYRVCQCCFYHRAMVPLTFPFQMWIFVFVLDKNGKLKKNIIYIFFLLKCLHQFHSF